MTKETIDLIIEWFAHIEQLATDRKTQTGAVMDAQHCLNEIAAIASESKQFVEEFQDEQEPIDEEELNVLAEQYACDSPIVHVYEGEIEAFKSGFRTGRSYCKGKG